MKPQTIDERIEENKNICITGGGGIGIGTGLVLRECGDFVDEIYIGDVNYKTARKAVDWIKEGSNKTNSIEAFPMPMEGTNDEFNAALRKSDIVLDCTPGSQAPRIAGLAKKNGLHYANLTEYVKETNEIMKMAQGSETAFLLQTGLAPGAINVLTYSLYNKFCEDFGADKVDYVSMKVGALGKNAMPPHKYNFTWSPAGVATEYLEPATVIRDFKKTTIPSLTERSTVIIDGVTYEQTDTAGGAADTTDALEGKVKNLDYKTLRYPGHYAWIDELLKDIPEGNGRAEKLQAKMQEFVPRCEDDVVIVYASVEGIDRDNTRRILEKSYKINTIKIGDKPLRAIQAATVSPLAQSARLLATDKYRGLITQSMIPEIDPGFMKGRFTSNVYQ